MHFVLGAVSSAPWSLTTEKMWAIVADRIGVPVFTILSIVSIVIVVLSALSNVHKTVRNPEFENSMSANGLKIGVVGGYVSGKATFLNALLKAPCFPMRSTGHNHSIVEIRRAVDETSSWDSMDSEDRRWLRSLENIREGNGHLRIRANIPCFLWGDAVFYDFPQISDILAWKREYLSFVEKMDLIVTLFDAEYVMALANQKIMDCLVPLEKKIAVILNKCEIVDDIADLSAQARQVFTNDDANLPIFTVSSELELLRWTSPKERQMSFAFTESRRNVMMICDLSFSSFRTWLYESIVSSEHTDREVKYAD